MAFNSLSKWAGRLNKQSLCSDIMEVMVRPTGSDEVGKCKVNCWPLGGQT